MPYSKADAVPALHFVDAGHRWPLVLVHGFPLDGGMWAPQLAALADERRVVAPDLAGCGASPMVVHPSLDEHADDVAALMDATGIERAVVAGHSMGGYVAMAFARRHPARLSGLVLACTRASADGEAARGDRERMAALVETHGVGVLPDLTFPRWFTASTPPHVVEEARRLILRQRPAAMAGLLRAMAARRDALPDLRRVGVPSLVVAAKDDALIDAGEAEAMAGALAEGELVVMSGSGHLASLEAPGAFNAALRRFLAKVDHERWITPPTAEQLESGVV